MFKTAKSDHPSPVPYVKVMDLQEVVRRERRRILRDGLQVPYEPDSSLNLQHENYGGVLWVGVGSDHGQDSEKTVVQVAGHKAHMLGMFKATDNRPNLERWFREQENWAEQLEALQQGITITDEETGEETLIPVKLFVLGDKMFISCFGGHQGSSATYPSFYRLVPAHHLKNAHRDGSEHSPRIPGCCFPARTPANMEADYFANLRSSRAGGLRGRGKHHHSMVALSLVRLQSQSQYVVSGLHIGLLMALLKMKFVELACDVKDGNAPRSALSKVSDLMMNEEDETEGGGEDEDGQAGPEDEPHGAREEQESPTEAANRAKLLELEGKLSETTVKFLQLEANLASKVEEVAGKKRLLDKFSRAEEGDWATVKQLAKGEAKALGHGQYELKKYQSKWPKDWRCECCVLTGYDRDVAWVECSSCSRFLIH